jgi:hypothetical protein
MKVYVVLASLDGFLDFFLGVKATREEAQVIVEDYFADTNEQAFIVEEEI